MALGTRVLLAWSRRSRSCLSSLDLRTLVDVVCCSDNVPNFKIQRAVTVFGPTTLNSSALATQFTSTCLSRAAARQSRKLDGHGLTDAGWCDGRCRSSAPETSTAA